MPLSQTIRTAYERLREFYSAESEPLRRNVYAAILALAAVAVAGGLVTGSVVTALAGPVALLLAVPAVERARGQVTPVAVSRGRHAREDAR